MKNAQALWTWSPPILWSASELQTERRDPASPGRLSLVKCTNLKVIYGKAVPCGHCLACLTNRRRVWTHRIMLEAGCHSENSFVTLTYADDTVPRIRTSSIDCIMNLQPKDLQDWLKRLRARIEPTRIRFYATGEYGDETCRPHYHAAIFGMPSCVYGTTRPSGKRASKDSGFDYRETGAYGCCEMCRLVQETWQLGGVYLGQLEHSSAQYVAGYINKKMTHRDDPRLHGREPEFSRMSNRPGIGAAMMQEVSDVLDQWNIVDRNGDVPSSLRHGKKYWPLGRYLTRRLRKLTMGVENAPKVTIEKAKAELRDVQDAAFANSESFEKALAKKMKPMEARHRARAQIYKTRKTI